MKAKFFSTFDFMGVEVFCYLDLDNNDLVWLEGGRNGKEMRRIPEPEITYKPQGRAVDIPPKYGPWKWVEKHYFMPPKHIH
jgi:hypothetical protein